MDKLLQEEIISIYKAWDSLERQLYGNEIIDFCAIKVESKHRFTARTHVIKALENVDEMLPSGEPEFEFIQKRIQASIYYLNACLGERIPFESYILGTMGVSPRLFPEEKVQKSFDAAQELLASLGIDFSREFHTEYEKRCLIVDRSSVKEQTEAQVKKWLSRLGRYIKVPTMEDVVITFVTEDAYWANWISGSIDNGVEIKINLHNRIKYLHGSPSMLAVHEYCGHLVQGTQWSLNAKSGLLDAACAFTTVHGPETFVMEGLSDSLAYILVNDDSELDFNETLARCLIRHRNIVNNNVHYLINTGLGFREVFDYYSKYLPFDDILRIESSIRDKSNDPLGRTYQYVYGIAQDYFLSIPNFAIKEKKCLLSELYSKPYTKSQLDQLVLNLASG